MITPFLLSVEVFFFFTKDNELKKEHDPYDKEHRYDTS